MNGKFMIFLSFFLFPSFYLLLFELRTLFFKSLHRISLDTTCYMHLRPYYLTPVLSTERNSLSNGKYTDR